MAFPHHTSQLFLNDIFGKSEGIVRMGGFGDASSVEDFDHKLDALEEAGNTRKTPNADQNGPQFIATLRVSKPMSFVIICATVFVKLLGLSFPPAIFTTNRYMYM